jgi:hypothetical protein
MSKALTFGFLLLSVATSTAYAQVLTVRCDLRPDSVVASNVYREDLTIDLAKRTVQQQNFSTIKDLDGRTLTYRNHRAEKGVVFDEDEYVLVSDDRIQWGNGKPNDGLGAIYYRQQKIMIDMENINYQCTEQ